MIGLRTGQILDRIARLVGLAGAAERDAVSSRAAQLEADPQLAVTLPAGLVTISGIGEGIGRRAAVGGGRRRCRRAHQRRSCHGSSAGSAKRAGSSSQAGGCNDPAVEAATHRRFPSAVRTGSASRAPSARRMAGIAAGVLDGEAAMSTRGGPT